MDETSEKKDFSARLAELRSFAKANFVPIMKPDMEKTFIELIDKTQPKSILEIGTAIGYSGTIMLLTAKNARLNTIEFDEARIKMAKENFLRAGVDSRVNVFQGDAKEIVRELTGEYDFIFMDGPKGQYIEFLPYLLDVLTVGGTLLCDNVGYMGLTQRAATLPNNHKHITIARNMARFLTEITSRADLETSVFFEIGDGISVSRKLR